MDWRRLLPNSFLRFSDRAANWRGIRGCHGSGIVYPLGSPGNSGISLAGQCLGLQAGDELLFCRCPTVVEKGFRFIVYILQMCEQSPSPTGECVPGNNFRTAVHPKAKDQIVAIVKPELLPELLRKIHSPILLDGYRKLRQLLSHMSMMS